MAPQFNTLQNKHAQSQKEFPLLRNVTVLNLTLACLWPILAAPPAWGQDPPPAQEEKTNYVIVTAPDAKESEHTAAAKLEQMAGATLTVRYATDQPHDKNWIGLYKADETPNGNIRSTVWKYAPGASGSIALDLQMDRVAPGDYRVWFLAQDKHKPLAEPVALKVTEFVSNSVSSIKADTDTQRQNTTLMVEYATNQPHKRNRISLYKADETPSRDLPVRVWQRAEQKSGTVWLDLDVAHIAPGDYRIWFLAQGGYTPLTDPLALTVIEDPDALEPGNPQAPVEIKPVTTDVTTDGVILREGFTSTAPEGWSVTFDNSMSEVGNETYRGWSFTTRQAWITDIDEMRGRFGRSHQTLAVADAQQFGGDRFASTLTSRPIEVSGLPRVRLTFDSHYRGHAGQAGVVRVSFDGGEPIEVLRLDSAKVTNDYDGRQMNAWQEAVIDIPAGTMHAVFSWEFTGGEGARYWAIDSVAVHKVLADTSGAPTQAWVVSDIQGFPQHLAHALQDLYPIAPDADGLLMVGDIVRTGTAEQWDEISSVMKEAQAYRPRQTIAAMGNHERLANGGFYANRDRFLAFAERERVWGEYVLKGPGGELPVIVLGQDAPAPPSVPMTENQMRFLEERLAYWTSLGKQIIVASHYPLSDTVSASWLPDYRGQYRLNDRLKTLFGNYPNVILFTGHTHLSPELGDWAMQRRTPGGHPDGFWAVNTAAMSEGWETIGENLRETREVKTTKVNYGLTLDSYGDRVVITAYDFLSDEQLRRIVIPNPLAPSDSAVSD